MYRDPPLICSVCGNAVDPPDADVLESGVRCRRCSEAAELAAVAPTVAEVRRIQRQYEPVLPYSRPRSHCRRHAEWDTHCFWCVLGDIFSSDD